MIDGGYEKNRWERQAKKFARDNFAKHSRMPGWRMRKLTVVMAAAFMASCVGDAVIFLHGNITSSTEVSCKLSLPEFSGGDLESYYSADITNEFNVEFVVEPRNRKYRIKIECENYGVVYREVEYSGKEQIELGFISLDEMKKL